MKDILSYSATKQAKLIQDGLLTARELAKAYLARINLCDLVVGAFLHVNEEAVLSQADMVDAKRAAGKPLGSLSGVPIGLKDLLVTKCMPTTAGSRILEGWIPPYDGTVVQKLRDADAVILGKLNMDEFAMGSSNEHSAYKLCRNPWNQERVPGGSSGGSAAAVAADLCSISLGTDTGGSIRQPASFCGVLGLKPTYGRVSRYGLIAYASSLDQIGPLVRYAEDAALVLEVIAGKDTKDATSLDEAVPSYIQSCTKGVEGMHIGIAHEMFSSDLDPQIRRAVEAGIDCLEKAGAIIKTIHLPHTKYALATYYLIATAEASSNLARYDGIRFGPRESDDEGLLRMYEDTRGKGFGPEVVRRILLGNYVLREGYCDAYYLKAQKVRTIIAQDFEKAFQEVDLIVSPTAPTTAFAFDAKKTPLEMYLADIFTLSCNLAGLPGMSVCCGFDDLKLPIGMQLLAAPLQEEKLLRAAVQFQKDTVWHEKRPHWEVSV